MATNSVLSIEAFRALVATHERCYLYVVLSQNFPDVRHDIVNLVTRAEWVPVDAKCLFEGRLIRGVTKVSFENYRSDIFIHELIK